MEGMMNGRKEEGGKGGRGGRRKNGGVGEYIEGF